MGPPTVTQRVEQIEDKIADLDGKIAEMVSKAVERAVEVMHHSLSEMLLEGQVKVTKQLGTDLEAMAGRLEGRVQRTREFHESLINSMKNDQLKFQSEIRSSLTDIQAGHVPVVNNHEGSVNKIGASPSSLAVFGGGEGYGQGAGGKQGEGVYSGQIFDGGRYGGFGSSGGIGGNTGGAGIGGTGVGGWRYRKLDMPIFEGVDPDGCILRIERYFNFCRLTEPEKLEAVVVALEGDALRWFQWENKRRPIRRWDELQEFMLRQFRPSSGGSLCEQWLVTTQTSTVNEYRRKFIETAAPLDRMPENIMLGQFLMGLKDDIRAEVRLLNPISLEQAMELAQRVEERNKINAAKKQGLGSYKGSQYSTVSFRNPNVGGSTVSSLNSSPASVRNWVTQTGDAQSSVSSPKTVISQNSSKTGGK